MFFNLKETVTKTKQSQLNYEVERVNARFENSFPKKLSLKKLHGFFCKKKNMVTIQIMIVS